MRVLSFNLTKYGKDVYSDGKSLKIMNPALILADNQGVTYTGTAAVYPANQMYQTGGALTLKYSTDSGTTWADGMPTNVGSYTVKAASAATIPLEPARQYPLQPVRLWLRQAKAVKPLKQARLLRLS